MGSLALRPFGLLPALAQSGPDYRALVCVFLFGGNDSNNTVIPMDDTNYKAYTSIRGSLALSGSRSHSDGHQRLRRALCLPRQTCRSCEHVLVEGTGRGRQCRIACAAFDPRAVSGAAGGAIPNNLFSHADQQLQWQSSIAQGNSSTGWGGRAADYIAAQKINSSNFPTFFSVAGNTLEGAGANTQPVALAPGQSLTLAGFNSTTASQAILSSLKNLLTLGSGASLVQAADDTMSASIARRDRLCRPRSPKPRR